MNNINEILKDKQLLTVNNTVDGYKDINKTVNCKTVISDKENSIDELLTQYLYEPKTAAKELSKKLGDENSIRYYLLLAKNNPIEKLFEALSFVIEADTQGRIRTKKAIYFIAIIRRWGLKVKFGK